MTSRTRTALKELQMLDTRIEEANKRLTDFDPLFQQVEEPALLLESEVGTTRKRLQELRLDERRLDIATEEKRARLKRLDERMGSVRNLREEAAVTAELEMVKRALQTEEQEAFSTLDQIRKLETRLAELEGSLKEARAVVEPRMKELIDQRNETRQEIEALGAERRSFVSEMDQKELRMYDGIRAGGRRTAVADLTEDGACGHCFGVIPLQLQNEIRHGAALVRCEACGVILTAQDPAPATGGPGRTG